MSIFMSISLDLRCAILFDNRKLVNEVVIVLLYKNFFFCKFFTNPFS
ncbi:MAG: hypothetical protein BROFUL_01593 [Candidatus Brocadia fulgida]|uniref:Uncharacterized protein n=1 Tax=Candidatus Brocadia fulgida TaxID=380242 RepID=A0A0M2UXH3_9BACT|nr:MAG: hypothetical protein BROFUL_01593 [Candidatus Brocadia fulgida]